MSDEKPGVKHITMTCPRAKCTIKAFVQVVTVEDAKTQEKIDKRARQKLRAALVLGHKEGKHV